MIKYEVNEDKRTVAAYFDEAAEGETIRLCNEIESAFNDYNYNSSKKLTEIEIYGVRNLAKKIKKGFDKFVGIAKCHPDDKFDVEKGKLVARDRLLYKWRTYKDRVFLQVIKELDEAHVTIKNNLVKKIYRKHELLEDI